MRKKIGEFWIVTSIGHCGTRWLSQVLHRPKLGVVFYHEKLQKMLGGWQTPLRLEWTHGLGYGRFEPYYRLLRGKLRRNRIVGDVGSWQACTIPALSEQVPIARVIYLVRNGIPQIQSRSKSYEKRGLADQFARKRWEELGQPSFSGWEEVTDWEKWCFEWSASIVYIRWLKVKMPVMVYRFEDLIGDQDILAELVQSAGLPVTGLKAWQGKDVNRHLKGDRSPQAIWKTWSRRQRGTFRAICGDGMREMEYRLPG